MRYQGEQFRDQRVSLDGHAFEGCLFTNVVFDYAGGPVELNGCTFDGFSWSFSGDLGRGLQMLGQFYAATPGTALSHVSKAMFPKPSSPATATSVPPSIAALIEKDREEAEAPAADPFDYSRLQSSIRRTGKMPRAAGFC